MKLLLIFIIAWQVSAAHAAPELKGRWKSNKELTVATFNLPDDMPKDIHDRWCYVFGKMIVTYSDRECVTRFPHLDESGEVTSRFKYRVEVETKDKLILASPDSETGEVTKTTLHFVSPDRYYVEWEDMPKDFTPMYGSREYFDRIESLDGSPGCPDETDQAAETVERPGTVENSERNNQPGEVTPLASPHVQRSATTRL